MSSPVIDRIVERILSVAQPDRIILFGSAATGRMEADSDIDLLVVEPHVEDERAEYVRVRQALGNLGRPVDVLFISSDWFEASRDVVGSIAYPADKHGKVIYESA